MPICPRCDSELKDAVETPVSNNYFCGYCRSFLVQYFEEDEIRNQVWIG